MTAPQDGAARRVEDDGATRGHTHTHTHLMIYRLPTCLLSPLAVSASRASPASSPLELFGGIVGAACRLETQTHIAGADAMGPA